jgi:hypothetical protein
MSGKIPWGKYFETKTNRILVIDLIENETTGIRAKSNRTA